MAKPPMAVFILSSLRSGSTWLNLVLGSHGWAMNLGEYFRPFRVPGHVACRLCEADGLPECTILHGIAAIPAARAFHFAAERSGRRVLIDASKHLDWCAEHIATGTLDVRIIHLIRHPCGYVESQGRREPGTTPDALLTRWETENRAIDAFIATAGVPALLASYDDLANDPAAHFPRLCRFLDHPYDPAALRYWEVPHHGLGGNGAAAPYLKDRPVANFLTGDDNFYETITARPTSADTRWQTRLAADFIARASATPYATEIRQRLAATHPV